jgi:hypothetical protein
MALTPQQQRLVKHIPDYDALVDARFIMNYLRAGCSPPVDLLLQLSGPPAADLALLLFGLDATDFAQAIFDPKAERSNKKERRGHKRRLRPGLPDMNETAGVKARAALNPNNALNFGPTHMAFRIWNRYEAVAITAAIVEGLSTTGFNWLWGTMRLDPTHCVEFRRLARGDQINAVAGGPGVGPAPTRMGALQMNNGFYSPNEFSCRVDTDYTFAVKAHVAHALTGDATTGRLCLIGELGETVATSDWVTLERGDEIRLQTWANRPANENTLIAWETDGGGWVDIKSRDILAFEIENLPMPWAISGT